MTQLEKVEVFKSRGWTYNPETGEIFSHKNKPVKYRLCRINSKSENIQLSKHTIAWYLQTGQLKSPIFHKDGNLDNNKWSNLTLTYSETILNKSKDKIDYTRKNYTRKKPILSRSGNTKYLNESDFTKEIIISQGKGKLTEKAYYYLYILSDELITKFNYTNSDDRYDCKMTGLLSMLSNWKGFNSERYYSAFPYFTEICKRGIARGLNQMYGKTNCRATIMKTVSLSNFNNFKF